MKSYFKFGVIFAIVLNVVTFAAYAFAEEVGAAVPPEWLDAVLAFIASMPTVGPILVEVLKYVALVTTIATALSTAFIMIATALAGFFNLVGLQAAADKVKEWADKILPWLKYLSMYNVQKK